MKRDLVSILDVQDDLTDIIDLSIRLKRRAKQGKSIQKLPGQTLGMIFEKPITCTRVSFEVGMTLLGGHAIYLNTNDIQLGRGESIEDTAVVLSRYVDLIMYRAKKAEAVRELAQYATVPVINGLDNREHPCQIITDLMTVREHKGRLQGLQFVYIGDGNNNMAHSYLLGCGIVGMNIRIVAPRQYQPEAFFVNEAKKRGVKVEVSEKMVGATSGADVVATDTWVSMGDEAEKAKRIQEFKGFTIDEKVMDEALGDAVFLHCLPAYYGYEVTKEVAHGPQSVIFDEAENRLWAQIGVMVTLAGSRARS